MTRSTLRGLKNWSRRSKLHGVLRSLGIISLGRRLYNRSIIRSGSLETNLMGARIRFAVESNREVTRIDDGFKEEVFLARIIEHIGPNDTFFDVGANIGVVSLLAAKLAEDRSPTIHAFEPEPRNADHLSENLRLNECSNVTLHRLALGDSSGEIDLFIEGETGSGTHSIMQARSHDRPAVRVRILRGDDFCEQENAVPDVIKIDVEGAELAVLRGFDQTLRANRIRHLFIEVHEGDPADGKVDPDELKSYLADRGYELEWERQRDNELHEHYRVRTNT